MKFLFLVLFSLCTVFSFENSLAQPAKDGWSLGFGGTYPRFISVSGIGYSGNTNFGGYLSFERNFNEYIALRLKGSFNHLESYYYRTNIADRQKVNFITTDLDLIYLLLPCQNVSPFILVGGGFVRSKSENSLTSDLNDEMIAGYELNLGLGVYWNLTETWKLKTEINYHTMSNNKLDGNIETNEQNKGIIGGNGDTYMGFELGLLWQIYSGERSTLCDKCPEGIREIIRIDTIYKEVPKITIEKDTIYRTKPMLFNVNFDFDKYSIRVESYPILEHAVNVLKENPDMEVIISGHTDSFGTDEYNDKLSQRRVNAIYDYLVSNGISSDRISKEAFGEKKPVRENNSAINRAFNRRVEFRIVD